MYSLVMFLVILTTTAFNVVSAIAIKNCPMESVKDVVARARELVPSDPILQMQMIRRVMEEIFGGKWGVLVVKDFQLIASSVHWTFPEQKQSDGSPAFCLHVEGEWQYNVFKTAEGDSNGRFSVKEVIRKTSSNDTNSRLKI